jgi:F-type H+-transporting ATPase subunit delta
MSINDDVAKFPEMYRIFSEMTDEYRGIARAEVITAVALDDARRRKIIDGLARLTGRVEVKITESVDGQIIGGVVAKVGDRLIDGSTRTLLQAMRDSLTERPI